MDGKTLTWRKFPRDTINNPALRYIAKHQPQECRHQVFTLFTALYCLADDGGVVDLSDLDVFADICMMDVTALESLLYEFLERNIMEEIIIDETQSYKLTNWLDPYPSPISNAARQKAYRERKKEQKSFKGFCSTAKKEKNLSDISSQQKSIEPIDTDDYSDLFNMTIEQINEFLLNQNSKDFEDAEPKYNACNALHNACNDENSCVTQRYNVTPKTEKKRTDRQEEQKEKIEEKDREELEEKENIEIEIEKEPEKIANGYDKDKVDTEEKERKKEKKKIKKQNTH